MWNNRTPHWSRRPSFPQMIIKRFLKDRRSHLSMAELCLSCPRAVPKVYLEGHSLQGYKSSAGESLVDYEMAKFNSNQNKQNVFKRSPRRGPRFRGEFWWSFHKNDASTYKEKEEKCSENSFIFLWAVRFIWTWTEWLRRVIEVSP